MPNKILITLKYRTVKCTVWCKNYYINGSYYHKTVFFFYSYDVFSMNSDLLYSKDVIRVIELCEIII